MAQNKKVRRSSKTGPSRKKPKTETYHHGNLKESLVAAALKLLERTSPNELSLRELASEAGVSPAAPYRHFQSKDELFALIGQQGFEKQSQFMEEAFRLSQGDPMKLYIQMGLSYFRMGLQNPQHFKLMFGAVVVKKEEFPGLLQAGSKTFVLLRNMVIACQNAGLMGAGDPYHKALNCWVVVHGFTTLFTDNRLEWLGVTVENAESALVDLMMQYLHGTKSSLAASTFFPFQTEYSKFFRNMMEQIPAMESKS